MPLENTKVPLKKILKHPHCYNLRTLEQRACHRPTKIYVMTQRFMDEGKKSNSTILVEENAYGDFLIFSMISVQDLQS